MKARYSLLAILLVGALLGVVLLGCATPVPTPTPPPPGIQYNIGQGADITKVSWYLTSDVLAVEVTVKNTATTTQKFDVAVNVDDEGFFSAGVEASKEVKAGATQVYLTQSTLTKPYPKKLQIRVTSIK